MVLRGKLSSSSVPMSPSAEGWKRVLHHPEAPMTARDMVSTASVALRKDIGYKCFREALGKLFEGGDNFKGLRKAAKGDTGGNGATKSSDLTIVDEMIDELLCFLAIKVLIAGEPIPSIFIQDAWLALVLLPITYGNVCRALGSPSVIEFQDHIESSDVKVKASKKERYSRTIESYKVLFNKDPIAVLWPAKRAKSFNVTWLKEIVSTREGPESFAPKEMQTSNHIREINFGWVKEIVSCHRGTEPSVPEKVQTTNHSWGMAPTQSTFSQSMYSDARTSMTDSWDDSTQWTDIDVDDLTLSSIRGINKRGGLYSKVFGC